MKIFNEKAYLQAVDSVTTGIEAFDKGLAFVLDNQKENDGFSMLYQHIRSKIGSQFLPPSKLFRKFLCEMSHTSLGLIEASQNMLNAESKICEEHASKYMDDLCDALKDGENLLKDMKEVRNAFGNIENADSYLQVILHSNYPVTYGFQNIADELLPLIENLSEQLDKLRGARDRVFSNLLERTDEELSKVTAYFKENEDAFQMTDLKLHDASFYEYSKIAEDFPVVARAMEEKVYGEEFSPFDDFCEREYENFGEWCKEQGIDFSKLRHQVGRTSSFYLHDEGNEVFLTRRPPVSISLRDTYACLLYELGGVEDEVRLESSGKLDISHAKSNVEGTMESVKYIASGAFLKDIEEKFEDTLKVSTYIKEFKENQVSYFKDYLEGLTDEILEHFPEYDTERDI